MYGRPIVKSRRATQFEMYGASDHRDRPHNLVRLFPILFNFNRHVIDQLGYAFFGEESREQNVRIGK